MHTVVETPSYLADAKSAGLTDGERDALKGILGDIVREYRKAVKRHV